MKVAAKVAGAEIASQRDLRAAGREYPLASTKFRLWDLPARHIQRGESPYWRMAVRSGPHAGGANEDYANLVKITTPAMLTFLHTPSAMAKSDTPEQ